MLTLPHIIPARPVPPSLSDDSIFTEQLDLKKFCPSGHIGSFRVDSKATLPNDQLATIIIIIIVRDVPGSVGGRLPKSEIKPNTHFLFSNYIDNILFTSVNRIYFKILKGERTLVAIKSEMRPYFSFASSD